MKIICEFTSWEEMEAFRSSAKKARGKGAAKDDEPTVEDVTAAVASSNAIEQQQHTAAAFTQPGQAGAGGFPGANGATPPQVHPLVTAILQRIDGAVGSGQSTEAVVTWFRQQIGPDAANATLDQIKQVFIPRMSDQQLRTIAPQLGIQA